MGYILSFIGGGVVGVVMMCCFIVSGQESRREEMRDADGQNKCDGL